METSTEPTKHYLDATQNGGHYNDMNAETQPQMPAGPTNDFSAITLADVAPVGGGLAYPAPGNKARAHRHPLGPVGLKRAVASWRNVRRPYLEYMAEFFGTMILILFGDGVVAQVVLSDHASGSSDAIHWAWGFGVLFGVYTAGGISGAHLNPAVTLTNCMFRGSAWSKLPGYVLAQVLGAFVAALLVYANYKTAFAAMAGNKTLATAGIFSTYPIASITTGWAFFEEVLATAMLLFLIYAITDPNNVRPVAGPVQPLMIALVVVAIGMSFGWQTGYAINPARDFGPRMAAAACGWGRSVFTADDHYTWLPIIAPLVGGPLGGFLYDFFIYDPPTSVGEGEF